MKKVYYNFSHKDMDSDPNLFLPLYLKPAKPSTSKWWSSLTVFNRGYKNIKTYFKDLVDGQFNEPMKSTIKMCPGILDLLENCWLVTSPCDFLLYPKNGSVVWDRAHSELINFYQHPKDEFYSKQNNLFEGKSNLKITLPIMFKVPTHCLFLQSTYHNNVFWNVVNGVLTPETLPVNPLSINTMIDDSIDEVFAIKKGTVLCYLWFPEKVQFVHQKNKMFAFKTKFNASKNNYVHS
jgi:hypothetical protein